MVQDTAPSPQPLPPRRITLESLQGLKVADIQINSPGIEKPEWLIAQLPQKVNTPLDKRQVQRSVQVLYDSGRFSAIQVEAQRTPANEVVLTFDARENYFFGSLLVDGAPGHPTGNQLVNASKLSLGEQFTDEKIKDGISGMQRVLQEDGYYKAKIQPFYEWDSHNQQVKVLFVLNAGEPARVGSLQVTGTPGYTPDEIWDIAKFHPGDEVTSSRLTRAFQQLRKRYQNDGRLEAQVTLSSKVYHPETNTVDYTFDITRGPKVNVKVQGVSLRQGLIKRYVPIFEENAVDEDLINEGKRNLRDYLQTKGYFEATVDSSTRQEPDGDTKDIIFQVSRGERHKLVAVNIHGNHYFSRETLRERMQIQTAGGLNLHGLFSQSLLNSDLQSMETLYRSNGFRQVKATAAVEDDYRGKKGQIAVTINITEGPQATVGKLTLEGNRAIPTSELLDLVQVREGQPYSEASVISDRDQITGSYYDRGFPEMRLQYSTAPEPGDPDKMDVSYTITEGPQIFVDKILISGLHFTRPYVVDREMRIKSGDPLSQDKMLESQSRLYDLGIFNAVEMAVQNPEGSATHKNLNFQLAEARRYTLNYGFGFQVQTGQPISNQTATPTNPPNPQGKTGFSPQVSFGVTRLNFRGRDHTITFQSKYGNLEKLALVGYNAPRWFDFEHLSLSFTTFFEETNDVRTFTARRLEGSAEIKHVVNKGTTILYRITYRRVSTTNLVIDPNLIPLFSQAVRVGMPEITFIRDTRDDPINSHKGTFSTLDYGIASSAFGSEANFTRVIMENSTYYQFHKRRWVFARSTRVGLESLFGSTAFLPLPERFFLGGPTSHRGFAINQAGPRDLTTGFPLGGQALFVNNLELRTPPLPLPWVGNNLSAVLFHDMGNVFATVKDMGSNFFKFKQPDRSTCLDPTAGACDFNYMSHAVGAGVRYRTPIGPVSFDLGYNLNPPAFPISDQSKSDTLKHLNFFFNIGQTF